MSTNEWKWWGGVDEEVCTYGPFDTKEDVIAEAAADGTGEFQDENGNWKIGVHVVEARKDPLRLADWIGDADELMERAEESVSDSDRASSEHDEPPYFECSKDQEADLERRIKAACDEWQAEHKLTFTTFTFSASRNHEYVVVDHPGLEQ
ncbi:hypothetical protein [Pelagibacterium luteolum]|uniref:Uncharacterized protein n=1 Tax=Pelagibacterium luteolum TaxID=440168 RepID=A0A1G7TJ86_9HYPH|nr:hypothetical protein [Pelagibacterium luteolum]SDG35396.1 hypothetical protein SAMN04487974_102165 [Pelagibacterium luteolum]